MVGHVRMAHGTEENRIERLELRDAVFRHHATSLDVTFAAPVEMAPIECEAEAFGGDFQNANALGNHFLANAVTGNDCDTIGFHVADSPAAGAVSGLERTCGC